MSTDLVMPRDGIVDASARTSVRKHGERWVLESVQWLLSPLASLKLTVVLFLLSIFLVFAGTLAQVDKDIWDVVHGYFRTTYVWIPLQVFFPKSFFPTLQNVQGSIPYPGGILIGSAMIVNLLAAHAVRFKVQASGARLFAGLAIMALGLVACVVAVASGVSSDGILETTLIPWQPLWRIFVGMLVLVCTTMGYSWFQLDATRRWERILLGVATLVLGAVTAWLVTRGDTARLDDSGMRILWQLLKGEAVALILFAGCYLLFKKRAGIVLLHGGIGLVMISEVVVSFWAVEGQMTMREGETMNYVSDIRTVELAVVDRSNPDRDTVVSIPKSVLTERSLIQDARLPFDIKVLEFMENSSLDPPKAEDQNLATAGLGKDLVAKPARPISGTDMNQGINYPSAYVTLIDKENKKELATHLVSLFFSVNKATEETEADGAKYDLELRHRRTYKPYSLTLRDVRKDDYVGTSTPKDYSSDVYLLDPTRNIDREKVHIWMNNPLRFAGETFYQSSYYLDPRNGAEYTTLSVVSNFGWMIPYIGCMIVGTGMLAQFITTLSRFLGRLDRAAGGPTFAESVQQVAKQTTPRARRRSEEVAVATPSDVGRSKAGLWCASGTVLLAALFVSYYAMKPIKEHAGMDLAAFGKLPVAHQGRVKPMDTLARNTLRILSGKLEFRDSKDKKQPAIRWLADILARPEEAMNHRVFRIDHQELLQTLGLERRKQHYYALTEFQDKLSVLEEQAEAARKSDPAKLSAYQRKVLELEEKIGEIITLRQAFSATMIRPDHAQEDVMAAMQRAESLERVTPALAIPPVEENGKWSAYSIATFDLWRREIMRAHGGEDAAKAPLANVKIHPAVDHLSQIFKAYAEGDAAAFNRTVAAYSNELAAAPPREYVARTAAFESFFNRAEPFYYAAVLYVIAFVLAVAGWLVYPQMLQRSAFWLLLFTLGFHTLALVARIYISGRPPVTNLYSSAVFIGWGCVALALILEFIYRLGIGSAVAGVAGFMTLLVAHFLSLDGDTFGVMQAVLDTQFWLATHVVSVSMGYATTLLAGLLGIAFVIMGVCTKELNKETSKTIAGMIYGVLCFAIFFSFVGTVLGGLWADDSWGRFWGWDPKENGALIIVLWNALVLHARWGKMVGDRGLAVLAVLGNICTCWSWFGVNELGVGLHSYGFTEGVLMWLGIAAATHLAIAAIGLLPQETWRSAKALGAEEPITATLVG